MDFNKLDEDFLIKMKKHKSRLDIANKLGYTTLSEFLIDKYYNKQDSGLMIVKTLRETQPSWIYIFFKKAGLIVRPIGVYTIPILKTDSYQEMDRKLRLKFIKEKTASANRLGYQYVSEAVVEMYYTHKISLKIIGLRFDSSTTWVADLLKKMNLVTRSHGGSRYRKLTNELKTKITKDLSSEKPTWETLRAYLEKNEINLSPKTIQNFLKEVKLGTQCQKFQDFLSNRQDTTTSNPLPEK